MSIQILNIHEHEIFFSVLNGPVKDSIYKYVIKGWFSLKKYGSLKLEENYYILLYCPFCDYKFSSDKNIKALTIDAPHDLLFKENCTKDPYSKENKKIEVDKKYYLAEYFLVKKNYKDNMFVGNEKDIRDYLFSEIENYKKLYEKEKEELNSKKKEFEVKLNEFEKKIMKLKNSYMDILIKKVNMILF